MAPPTKRTRVEMAESSNKRMKPSETLPEDLLEHIMSTYLPVQSLLTTRVLSKRFRETKVRSLDLDFSGIYSRRRRKVEVVGIIEKVFNQHKGSEIHRFVLLLNHIGVEDKIISWTNTCFGKNIKELVLDFSKSRKVMAIPIDFSAVESLQVLKLRWCKFEIPDSSPKGLKLLKTLSLMRTQVMVKTIDAIFNNCIHLESLELIECRMDGILSIRAQNHKKFKSLVVSFMPDLRHIRLDAPTLENYKYDGYVICVNILITNALKEANLYYTRIRRLYHQKSDLVDTLRFYTRLTVLATTTIFLEALTKRYVGEGRLENPPFKFENLTEFKISFITPTFCTLFDIAELLKECPKLKQVVIDIQNFTFEPQMYFWEIHHKAQIQNTSNNNYLLKCLTDVKIIGYKGHWHELDIVEFFVKNAPSLKRLELQMPKNAKNDAHTPDVARIKLIKTIFSGVKVTEV
ncbi:FBD-associated F-box protein [Arabidopsis thaliana]|uniref:At1g61320/AtMIF1 LRR domain-containing protein n=2 Tax=Arabidopsis TaxID=3701 RepID=A0A178WIJ8_ARATH|nr:hypothetical protein AXX17_AT1G54500 [Arabidopsis thaliana]